LFCSLTGAALALAAALGASVPVFGLPVLIGLTLATFSVFVWDKRLAAKQTRLKKKYATFIRTIKSILKQLNQVTAEMPKLVALQSSILAMNNGHCYKLPKRFLENNDFMDAVSARGAAAAASMKKVKFPAVDKKLHTAKAKAFNQAKDNTDCKAAIEGKPLDDAGWQYSTQNPAAVAMCGVVKLKTAVDSIASLKIPPAAELKKQCDDLIAEFNKVRIIPEMAEPSLTSAHTQLTLLCFSLDSSSGSCPRCA
jgi:hypothetical protein